MVMFTECQKHCVNCMSSDFCEECEDDLEPVLGRGCAKPCKLGYYPSPYATECLGKAIVTMDNSFYCCHGSLRQTLFKLHRTEPMSQLFGQLHLVQ